MMGLQVDMTISDSDLTGPSEVPWMTTEKLQFMTPLDRARWAVKELTLVDKFDLAAELIKALREEVV